MEGNLPQYIDDTPRSETEEEDDDSMTAESVVDISCHRPSKGTNWGDNGSSTDDSNAPLPT